jgi:hypothetical protein
MIEMILSNEIYAKPEPPGFQPREGSDHVRL